LKILLPAAKEFLDAVLDGPDYDTFFAAFEADDSASRRLSEVFGFSVFAEKDGKVFAMRD